MDTALSSTMVNDITPAQIVLSYIPMDSSTFDYFSRQAIIPGFSWKKLVEQTANRSIGSSSVSSESSIHGRSSVALDLLHELESEHYSGWDWMGFEDYTTWVIRNMLKNLGSCQEDTLTANAFYEECAEKFPRFYVSGNIIAAPDTDSLIPLRQEPHSYFPKLTNKYVPIGYYWASYIYNNEHWTNDKFDLFRATLGAQRFHKNNNHYQDALLTLIINSVDWIKGNRDLVFVTSMTQMVYAGIYRDTLLQLVDNSMNLVKKNPNFFASFETQKLFENYHKDAWISLINSIVEWKEGNPYVVYATSSVQRTQQEVSFYLITKAHHDKNGWVPPDFTVNVQSPGNSFEYIPVSIQEDRGKPVKCFYCTFWALKIGRYSVNVLAGGILHAEGSPLSIEVSNDPAILLSQVVNTVSLRGHNGYFLSTSKLWGVTYNAERNEIYAADRFNTEILVFKRGDERRLSIHTKWRIPSNPEHTEEVHFTGIALDNMKQRVYVTDKGNHCVICMSCTGDFLFSFGKRGDAHGEFAYPWGVAVSPSGELVAVADSKNHRIQLFNSKGDFIRQFSAFALNPRRYRMEFDYPRGIAFDASGTRIFVTDFNVGVIFKFDIPLVHKWKINRANQFVRPQGITVDPLTENLIVCDSRVGVVRILTPGGVELKKIGNGRYFSLETPVFACAVIDRICIVDCGGLRIQLLKY